MTKYKQTIEDMLKHNRELFDKFIEVHNRYLTDPKATQAEFNEIGSEVQDIVRHYENRLCGKSMNTGYGKFSTSLADKFQAEIKKYFPKYDFIGME